MTTGPQLSLVRNVPLLMSILCPTAWLSLIRFAPSDRPGVFRAGSPCADDDS